MSTRPTFFVLLLSALVVVPALYAVRAGSAYVLASPPALKIACQTKHLLLRLPTNPQDTSIHPALFIIGSGFVLAPLVVPALHAVRAGSAYVLASILLYGLVNWQKMLHAFIVVLVVFVLTDGFTTRATTITWLLTVAYVATVLFEDSFAVRCIIMAVDNPKFFISESISKLQQEIRKRWNTIAGSWNVLDADEMELSVDAAASLPAQCERGAESNLEGCVSASSVTKPSSTSLPLPPVLVVIPASSSSKAQLPVHASIERLSDHLDSKPLHHEETKITQPQPASLKHSSTNHNLPVFTPAPAIGNKLPPPAKSRGDPIRRIPAPIPSQPPNEGCSRPQPVINPHSPGLASNAADFGVNMVTLKPLKAFDVESQAPVSHPLSNGAPPEGLSHVVKELEASNAQVVAARDELRKQNQQLKSLLREQEERRAKDQEQKKFWNAHVEALMEERARMKETWSELQTMLLARIETLETQLVNKDTQRLSEIAHAEKLYNAGFAKMHAKIVQLTTQRDQITNALL